MKASSSLIKNITWSDHASVSLTLEDSLSSNATLIWRSNLRLLQLSESKNWIEQCLIDYFKDNAPSVDGPFLHWNAHKAFIRGIFIKLGAQMKRQRLKLLDDLTKEIQILDSQNKTNPSSHISQKLSYTRHKFRSILLDNFEKTSRRLKMSYYANGNKASKPLAQRLRGVRYKRSLSFSTQKPLTNCTIHKQ